MSVYYQWTIVLLAITGASYLVWAVMWWLPKKVIK